MKRRLKSMAAAACLLAAAGASQAALTPTGLDCNNGGVMTSGFNPDALACSGAWMGNDAQLQADVLAQAATDFNGIVGSGMVWTWAGKSDDADSGPFAANADGSTGTLTFDTPMTGYFAISLKSSESFSMYLFNGGTTGISSIDYSTLGVSLNDRGTAQGLSHAALLVPVPEPGTYALMLAGLVAVGYTARRRMKR